MPFLPGTPAPPPAVYQLIRGAELWMDDGMDGGPRAGLAIVIRDGKILAVGPEEAMKKAHPRAQVVQLNGGTLMPGFIEGHAHVSELGAMVRSVDLKGATSPQEALARVKAWMASNPDGWVLGRGWDQNLWADKSFPTALELDAITAGRPAFLERVDGHAAWVNSAALKAANIQTDTPDPKGGRILRDGSGVATGIIMEDPAKVLILSKIPAPTAAQIDGQVRAGLEALRQQGFTSVADMADYGLGGRLVESFRRMNAANALPIRVFAYLHHDQATMLNELKAPRSSSVSFFQVQGVKFYLDGALGSRGARLLAPYSDAPDTSGIWVTDPIKVGHDAELVLRAGYQPAIHAIGDAANRVALDVLEKAMAKASAKGAHAPSPRIEHAQVVTAEDAARFGRLHIVASVQPVHCTSDYAWTPSRLGSQRISEAFPWRRFLDGGAVIAFGSDAPVEDSNPFITLAAAETRQDPSNQPPGGFLPDQRMTRVESIRAYTLGNAQALGRKDLGVLKVGAVADLLWVEVPILSLSPDALRKLHPGALWVAGRRVNPPDPAP